MPLIPKSFADMFDYTRASAGSYFSSAGNLVEATVDQPRFDHDPVTFEKLGIMIEGQSTNLLTHSEAASNWARDDVAITDNDVISPRGTQDASSVYETATTAQHRVKRTNRALGANEKKTWSIFIKSLGSEQRGLNFNLYDNSVASSAAAINIEDPFVDQIVTGATGPLGGNASAKFLNLKNGWVRVSFTVIGDASSRNALTVIFTMTNNGSTTYLGDPSIGLALWGVQEEVGACTSYIKTTSASVTRARDDLLVSSNIPWFRQGYGTFLIEARAPVAHASVRFFHSGQGPNIADRFFVISLGSGALKLRAFLGADLIVDEDIAPAGTYSDGEPVLIAVAFDAGANIFRAAVNGVATGEFPVPSIPDLQSYLKIASAPASEHIVGVVKDFQYFPYPASAAELAAMTQ